MKPALQVFNFSMSNQSEDSVDISIDGYIVDSPTLEMYQQYWGDETSVSYKSFRDKIPANVKTINLIVNSGGGHVGDAMAIHDYLVELEAKGVIVNREGRGIVASAATYPVMGNNSRLSENCLFMIHEVSGYAYGNLTVMENQVKAMRKFNDMIVNFYARETGQSTTVISNMMKAETWLTADEAKTKGFVKNTGPKATLTNSITPEHWPFTNTAMLNTYNSFISNSKNTEMDTSKISEAISNGFNALLEKLGIKDKATDENVKNAFTEFSKSITDSFPKTAAPDEAALQNLVDTAITNALKTLPENFTKAITDATGGLATKEEVKNLATKTDLTDECKKITDSVSKLVGNKTPGTEDEEEKKKNEKKILRNNRFAGADFQMK